MSCYNRTYYSSNEYNQPVEDRSILPQNEFINIPQERVDFGFPVFRYSRK